MVRQKIYNVCIAVFVLIAVGVSPVTAQEMPVYNKGLVLYSSGDFEGAAEEWGSIARRLELLGGDRESYTRRAAFSYVISTISYEKANNSLAYDSWISSINLYSKINSSWSYQKGLIEKRIDNIAVDNDGIMNKLLKSDDRVLLNMNDRLNLVYYSGPRAGLTASKNRFGNDAYNQ